MKLNKQQYVFIILTSIAMILGMYITITGSASEVACYERIFGRAITFRTFDKILSRSFSLGLFLMTATRANVSVWACLIFFLLMVIPVLVQLLIYFGASQN